MQELGGRNFFGQGAPGNILSLGNNLTRHARTGDRWVDSDTGLNYIRNVNDEWTLMFSNNLNENEKIYNDNIYKMVWITVTDPGFESSGSGFFITPSGLIATASHVVFNSLTKLPYLNIYVTIYPENVLVPCIVIGNNTRTDFALISIDLADPSLPEPLSRRSFFNSNFPNSRQIPIGSPIFTLGNPAGFVQSVSLGSIINNMSVNSAVGIEYISADMEVGAGNSGGPLINLDGRVIGIASNVIPDSVNTSIGLPFFTSSFLIQPILTYFLNQIQMGNTIYPFQYPGGFFGILGKYFDEIDLLLNQNYIDNVGYDNINGVLIAQTIPLTNPIYPGSPANMNGLVTGDIIISAALHGDPQVTIGKYSGQLIFGTFILQAGSGTLIDIVYLEAGANYTPVFIQNITLASLPSALNTRNNNYT